jgi:hypothetical protein
MWLRTDEQGEAVRSLYKTHQFVLETKNDVYNWKWVIISLHNSAQAFMVLALHGHTTLDVIKNPKKTLDAIYGKREYPKEYLRTFLDLYDKVKFKVHMNSTDSGRIFLNSNELDEAMEQLNEYRNTFIHFIPCSWSLEIVSLPKLCRDVLSILEFLIFDSGNVRFYEDDDSQKAELAEVIDKIKKELEKLETEYIISIASPDQTISR